MNATNKKSPSLDEVLDEIASRATTPNALQLRELTGKYPQFKKEIIDFVTDLAAMDIAPSGDELSTDDVDLIVDRAVSRVNQMLFDSQKAKVLTDLYADIKASGHDTDSFRSLIGVDHSLLDCLANRLVRPGSVPRRLVETMAAVLRREADNVRAFLAMPPVAATAYKSKAKPAVRQMEFNELVEHADLPETEKQAWLGEEADEKRAN